MGPHLRRMLPCLDSILAEPGLVVDQNSLARAFDPFLDFAFVDQKMASDSEQTISCLCRLGCWGLVERFEGLARDTAGTLERGD